MTCSTEPAEEPVSCEQVHSRQSAWSAVAMCHRIAPRMFWHTWCRLCCVVRAPCFTSLCCQTISLCFPVAMPSHTGGRHAHRPVATGCCSLGSASPTVPHSGRRIASAVRPRGGNRDTLGGADEILHGA